MVSTAGVRRFITVGGVGRFDVDLHGSVLTLVGTAEEVGEDYLAIRVAEQLHVLEFSSLRAFSMDDPVSGVRQASEPPPPDEPVEPPSTRSGEDRPPTIPITLAAPASAPLVPAPAAKSLPVNTPHLSDTLPNAPKPRFSGYGPNWSEDQRNAYGHAQNVWNYAIKVRELDRVLFEVRPLWDAGLQSDDVQLLSLAGQLAFWGGDLPEAISILSELLDDGPLEGIKLLIHAQYRSGRQLDAANTCALLARRVQEETESRTIEDQADWLKLCETWMGELGEDLARTLTETVADMVAELPQSRPDGARPPQQKGDVDRSQEIRLVKHTGRIDRVWPRDAYGFISFGSPSGGHRTVYFDFKDISDEGLLKAIQSGWTGTVTFKERIENPGGSSENRRAIEILPLVAIAQATHRVSGVVATRKRPEVSRGGTRSGSQSKPRASYQRAKRLELDGELDAAADAYREVISLRQPEWPSAVKDLAWLLNRVGKWQDALRLLDEHEPANHASRAALNLRMHILLKGKDYESARKVIQRLYEGADPKQMQGLLKQDVYCLVAMSHAQQAIRLLDRGIEEYPADRSLVDLKDRIVALGRETAQIDLASLEAVGSGMTPFSRYFLESAAMVGADERSKARGYFDEKDFRLVFKAFEQIRGRRQGERAQFMLTLAVMCWRDPLSSGNYQLSELLRRFFTLMAEAELAAGGSPDVVRTYASEALAISQPQDIIYAIPALLDTYTEPTAGETQERLAKQRSLMSLDLQALSQFVSHLPFYQAKCGFFVETLKSEWGRGHALFAQFGDEVSAVGEEQRRQADLMLAVLDDLTSGLGNPSLAKIRDVIAAIEQWTPNAFFRLDKERLRVLTKILQTVERCLTEEDYSEQQNAFDRARIEVTRLSEECVRQPTYLSVVGIRPFCAQLAQRLNEMQTNSRTEARSSLDVKDAFENDRYKIEQDGNVRITLVLSVPPGAPPLEDVTVDVDQSTGLRVEGAGRVFPILTSGQRREVRLKVEPTAQQLLERAFTVSGVFAYHYNEVSDERRFSIPVRLDDDLDFQPIANPFEAYAGGTIVSDPEMFYGRTDILDRIVNQVTTGANGQCFVLYGQKRSGKSSVLAQVRRRLEGNALGVKVTMGEIDTVNANFSFLGVCLSEVYESLRDSPFTSVISIPDVRPDVVTLEFFKGELRRIRRSLDSLGLVDFRIVLLVDEFTYVFGYIRRGMMDASFMRLWKALLESGLVNTVVVGQDSMPRFKQEFANEFGVTKDERLSYLRVDDARALASDPIQLNGESRFRGDSLARLIWYTGGSPWYMQIMCDRLVQKLNSEGASLVTEADIDDVALELVSGSDRLGIEKFDPLITASADIEELFPRSDYLDVLQAIASSTNSNGVLSSELYLESIVRPSNLGSIIDDLVARDVVRRRETGHMRIAVGLFERWLRVNRPFEERE